MDFVETRRLGLEATNWHVIPEVDGMWAWLSDYPSCQRHYGIGSGCGSCP
jgi:hypothetical protein